MIELLSLDPAASSKRRSHLSVAARLATSPHRHQSHFHSPVAPPRYVSNSHRLSFSL
uniref:Uncharacterized protein n=1 Tax=Fagus sylvatica TaxID=28930 RepID=A0A2N9GVR7_FAGSY